MKKFYVYPQIPFGTILLLILGLIMYFFTLFAPNVYNKDLWMIIFITIMMLVVPIVINIIIIPIMWAKIEINDKGITKFLFGIKIKHFAWEEICEIKGLDCEFKSTCLAFLTKHIPSEQVDKCLWSKCSIIIHRRQSVIEAINYFRPNSYN